MKNLGAMMKQAQQMQAKMAELQSKAAAQEAVGTAGADAVSVTMTGENVAKAVAIDPKLCTPDDRELLEDLLVAAINDAQAKIKAAMEAETQKLMGGLQLPPGIKLPF